MKVMYESKDRIDLLGLITAMSLAMASLRVANVWLHLCREYLGVKSVSGVCVLSF